MLRFLLTQREGKVCKGKRDRERGKGGGGRDKGGRVTRYKEGVLEGGRCKRGGLRTIISYTCVIFTLRSVLTSWSCHKSFVNYRLALFFHVGILSSENILHRISSLPFVFTAVLLALRD